jgi:hypothetical protein
MSTDFVEGWVRRNAAERPAGVVPSALERLAFLHGSRDRALGAEWAQLSEKDSAHLSGLLEIVQSTGDLSARACCFHNCIALPPEPCLKQRQHVAQLPCARQLQQTVRF